MTAENIDYFRQRAAAERDMARNAASPEIAAIHEELARGYDSLAKQAEPERVLRAVG